MTSLWARIKPLLARVQQPARYIGCEDGAVTPRPAPDRVSWLLAYPDTYEIGLPNQGLQILYEILNERSGAVAERTYAPREALSVTSVADDPRPHLCAVLATNGRGLRPTEFAGALFPALDPINVTGRVLRTHQWIERDAVRREIIPARAVATRTPVGCA